MSAARRGVARDADAHDLLAGLALYWRGLGDRARDHWSRAADAQDPLTAALAAVGLADLCESRGDRDAAATWYRRGVAQAPLAIPGSSLQTLVTSAGEHLARLEARGESS